VPGRPAAALLRQSAGCSKVSDYEEDDVRVTTAFNRMLGLPGAWVRDVAFGAEGMIVTVALCRKRPLCSGCGAGDLNIKDHRTKTWRHLDVGGGRCFIECGRPLALPRHERALGHAREAPAHREARVVVAVRLRSPDQIMPSGASRRGPQRPPEPKDWTPGSDAKRSTAGQDRPRSHTFVFWGAVR